LRLVDRADHRFALRAHAMTLLRVRSDPRRRARTCGMLQ
jgi:hypothetical protein